MSVGAAVPFDAVPAYKAIMEALRNRRADAR